MQLLPTCLRLSRPPIGVRRLHVAATPQSLFFHSRSCSRNFPIRIPRVVIREVRATTSQSSSVPLSSDQSIAKDIENDSTTFPSLPKASSVTKYKPVPDVKWQDLPQLYRDLSKGKLAALVALTTMSGYAIAPGVAQVSTLLCTTAGTALCIASANAINQWVEIPYDAQMTRTRNRVLVRKALSPFHAWSFGLVTGLSGISLLWTCVNPLTAILGGLNLLLYTGVYTPLKRISIANTWAGAVVGAIPPMMGWAASTNHLDLGAWVLGGILYAWQFPHFNSLSWSLRADYSKAGYHMMCATNPALNARVSLRYSLAMFPLCWAMPYLDITTSLFAVDSAIVNGFMAWGAYRFWSESNEKTARQLFFGSIIHLPAILALMMLHKKKQKVEDELEEEDEGFVAE